MKKVGIVVMSIILMYALFIVEESIRLSKNSLAEPLIVFEKSHSGNLGDVTYRSLGFTLKTEYAKVNSSNDDIYPVSQEFWLFNKFLIWGWVS